MNAIQEAALRRIVERARKHGIAVPGVVLAAARAMEDGEAALSHLLVWTNAAMERRGLDVRIDDTEDEPELSPMVLLRSHLGDARLAAERQALALGEATKQAGATWIREELPKRFAVGAALRFGWKPRTKGYALRKGKRRGHQKDMVWTGNMQRMVLSTARTTFNRRSLRTTITFAVPEYADIRRQSARGTTIRSEISKLILADTAAIQQEVARLLPEMLVNNPKYRVKRKRKKL